MKRQKPQPPGPEMWRDMDLWAALARRQDPPQMVNAMAGPQWQMVKEGKLLTTRDAARYLGVTVVTMRRWRSDGIGPEYTRLDVPGMTHDLLGRDRRLVVYSIEALDKFKQSPQYQGHMTGPIKCIDCGQLLHRAEMIPHMIDHMKRRPEHGCDHYVEYHVRSKKRKTHEKTS